MDSKWSYMISGFNAALCFVGAVCGSMLLLLMGLVFGLVNYYIAELNRRFEDEQLIKASKETNE